MLKRQNKEARRVIPSCRHVFKMLNNEEPKVKPTATTISNPKNKSPYLEFLSKKFVEKLKLKFHGIFITVSHPWWHGNGW